MRCIAMIAVIVTLAGLVGCAGRAEILPNSDKALQKTSAEFAADAAKRHPYKADAPRGGEAMARAEVGYVWDRLKVANLSDSDWTDVEVWVNGQYVVYLPVMQAKTIKNIPFQAIFNSSGHSLPTGNGKLFNRQPFVIEKVELFRDGKLYAVPIQSEE